MLDNLDVVFSLGSAGNSPGEIRQQTGRLMIGVRSDLVGPTSKVALHAAAGVVNDIFTRYLQPALLNHGVSLTISEAARSRASEAFAAQVLSDQSNKRTAITDDGRKTLLYGIIDAAENMPEELKDTLRREIEAQFNTQDRLTPTPAGVGARI